MQKIGKVASSGFSCEFLQEISTQFPGCEWIDLNLDMPETEKAGVLIIRKGVSALGISTDDLFKEQKALDWDKKALMRGRVVNKHARHNLCYDTKEQEPDYENGKGRIVSWSSVPVLNTLKVKLEEMLKTKFIAEGNRYYDVSKCGIGFHGDTERRQVVGCRLGVSMNLIYQWYRNGMKVGNPVNLMLNHGDIYIMSEKAVGFDWKKQKIYTLRHAAGSQKYIDSKKRKQTQIFSISQRINALRKKLI
jgi:alkylated DNA repair dioxygenase AlkB